MATSSGTARIAENMIAVGPGGLDALALVITRQTLTSLKFRVAFDAACLAALLRDPERRTSGSYPKLTVKNALTLLVTNFDIELEF